MKILFLSPGFPAEMPRFTHGLAEVGARVWGIGDQPAEALPEPTRRALSGYLRVRSLWDEEAVIEEVRDLHRRVGLDRVECLWEPGMTVAARLREALGLPGMTVAETVPFRDKEAMKRVLDEAGIRTPRHARASTVSAVREAAERIGYPLIVKPIAGAGSADTHRVEDASELEAVLPRVAHVEEVSVEEFIDGEEYTFDAVTVGGEIVYYNIGWYRPRPLIARTVEWISPQTVALRNPDVPRLAGGRQMGAAVLEALGFRTGFSHMEWYLKPDGEAVFGEIGGRPPGGRSVDTMVYACDLDLYRGWAEAVVRRRFSQPVTRRYNSVAIFKRAQGEGRIRRIEGLDGLLARFGPWVADIQLLPVGASRRSWKQSLLSDGWLMVRHPNLDDALHIADRVGVELQMYAG